MYMYNNMCVFAFLMFGIASHCTNWCGHSCVGIYFLLSSRLYVFYQTKNDSAGFCSQFGYTTISVWPKHMYTT